MRLGSTYEIFTPPGVSVAVIVALMLSVAVVAVAAVAVAVVAVVVLLRLLRVLVATMHAEAEPHYQPPSLRLARPTFLFAERCRTPLTAKVVTLANKK